MPVKIFVRRDSQGRELPANHGHESWASIDIIRRISSVYRSNYEDDPTLYAIGVNLEYPPADLVIISNRGIGVIELKDVYGRITGGPNTHWQAYNHRERTITISGGTNELGKKRLNPHKQVQDYAWKIKQMLSTYEPLLRQWPATDIQRLYIHTAVCFTHPKANIDKFRTEYGPFHSPWERFRLLKPQEVPKWAYAISFEQEQYVKGQYGSKGFEPYLLGDEQVDQIMRDLFRMEESKEIPKLLFEGKPFGYLTRLEGDKRVQVFAVYPGATVIGRNPVCEVPIPGRYASVSRDHARIRYSLEGISIEDLKSKHGTYVDGIRLQPEHPRKIVNGKIITLCSPDALEKACLLEFSETSVKPPPTI